MHVARAQGAVERVDRTAAVLALLERAEVQAVAREKVLAVARLPAAADRMLGVERRRGGRAAGGGGSVDGDAADFFVGRHDGGGVEGMRWWCGV